MTLVKVSDSMTTIQTKLNKGGVIEFEKGTYVITRQLILQPNTRLLMRQATLKRCGNIQSIFINACKSTTTKYNGSGDIQITDGNFEGMHPFTPDNLITFFHGHDIKIQNCNFYDTVCHAIEINSCANVTIDKCKFLGYNCKVKGNEYKEMIQIDSAYSAGFFLNGSSKTSRCYDGTGCKNITINKCEFTKSNYRDYPSACIGAHAQVLGGKYHENITISENKFTCGGADKTAACISIIGMKNVIVKNNVFNQCGKLARVYSKSYSYTLDGRQVDAKINDGKCQQLYFVNNYFYGTLGDNKCSGIYIFSKSETIHENIKVLDNKFDKSQKTEKYYLWLDKCKNIEVKNNDTELKVRTVSSN